ncbi:MAG: insulinase family protein, partial [Planctomycetota bacterium]|nr:insulinase family protein [Planctomycetota bacterium]
MGTMKKVGLCALFLAMSVGPVLAGPDGKKKKKQVKKQNKKGQGKKAAKKRVEKALTLKNGLKVFLVSDPSMDRSAAALSVNVGSMNDGKYPGIAHFLEHMLFLGTKKYPKEGDYKDYLAANNGSSNAYTAYDHTNYFFEVKTDAFEGALDRFSRFFVSPLLTDSGSEREVNAVDSEHSKNLESEYWRARQVYRGNMNPKHPHNNFATGSKKTLGGVKNATLVKFYESTYSSKIMNLVIVSPLSMKKLESWSRSKFNAIPDRGHKAKRAAMKLFDKNIAGHRLDIVSIRDVRDLWIRFELPKASFDYRSKSHAIVGFVLGHEGRESLLQQLKKEGLATSLSAGGRQLGEQGTFNMTLSLTEKGLKDVDLVLERVFAMINRLRGLKEFPAQLIEQERKMSEINFRFRQVTGASAEAQSLAASMISVPHENLLRNMFIVQKPDQNAIRGVLDSLVPENAVVVLLNKKLKADLTEPHYQVKYAKTALDAALVTRLKSAKPVGDMALPAPNNFIPSNFNLVKTKNAKKPFIYRSKYAEVWLRHDTKFKQPKAAMQFQVFNTNYRSAKAFVLGQIFQAAVSEALNPYTYPMNQAGVSLGVASERGGITISAGGYSHKL